MCGERFEGVGILECWSVGIGVLTDFDVLTYWSGGVVECSGIGVLECWSVGMLACWRIGVLEC